MKVAASVLLVPLAANFVRLVPCRASPAPRPMK
jgi:hypothetical protein